MKGNFTKCMFSLLAFLLIGFTSFAQFTVTTSPPLVANNGQQGVTFELSTTASIIVTGISNTFNSGVQTAEVWYRIGGVQHATGTAPNITAANGWVLLDNNISVTGNNTTPVPIPNLSTLTIPANTDVGFFIGGGTRYQTHAGTPDQFTDGTVTIKTGPNFGYGGGAPNPTFTPRQFLGSVTYIFSGPCTDPPTAGFAVVDDPSPCINENVTVSLDSSSFGLGQSYQWQVSLDGTTWLSLPGDTLSNVTITASDTAYYRAIVFCGNGSDTSTAALVQPVGAPLSGTYTINQNAAASATNYTSFQAFFDDLECGGVSGPVTVNVVTGSGPYIERVVAPEVAGVSSVNTITINGNGNELQHAGGTSDRATLTFEGTDWVHIDNLVIEATGASFGWTLHLTGGADHNTFTNCEFLSSETSTSTFFANIVMSNSNTSPTITGASGSYNHFENNLIKGGYYGVTVNGAGATSMEVGNTFINNEIAEWRYYGMYVRAQDSMVIHGNDIHRETRGDHTFHRGIHFFTGMRNARVTNNKFRDFHTGTGGSTNTSANYVIYMSSANGSATEPNVIANNLMYNMNNTGAFYGIYNFNSSDWYVYHNTFALDFSTTSSNLSRVYYHTSTGNNLEFKNNIIYFERPGSGQIHGVYLNNASADIDIEGNAYYFPDLSNSNVHIGYVGSNQSDLTDWQAASGGAFDQNAVHVDPFFVNLATDSLRPQNSALKFIGDNVQSLVPVDFDSVARPTSPDPGAYQFEPPQGADMTIMSFQSPTAGCPGTQDVTIRVNNLASDTVETILVNWSINNVAQAPVLVTDSFFPGNIIDITLGNFTVSGTGSYDIEVSIDSIYPGVDLDLSNNSAEILGYRSGLAGTFTINQLALPSASNFSSFTDFADALNSFGVCGDVVVDVVSGTGPYNEQVLFSSVSGTSDTSTVTINGNGNELNYLSTSAGERYTLGLSGVSYFTVDSLRIVALGGGTNEFGWGVWLTANANHNTIKNCEVVVDSTQTTTNYGGIIMSSDASNALPFGSAPFGNYNTIENNTIIGGYYGLTCIANNINDQSVGNKILNNTITDYRFHGMYFRGQDSLEVRGNEITRGTRSLSGFVTYYGMFFSNGFTNCIIDGNRMYGSCNSCNNVTSTQFAVYFSGASGNSGNENVFSNNQIYDINGDGAAYGLYMFNNNFWKFYHNTIVLDDPNAGSTNVWAVYSSGNIPNTEFKNNIFYVDQGGNNIGLNFITANNNAVSDYNVFHVPNGNVGRSGTTDYQTLADWSPLGYDDNSLEADPGFIGTGADQNRPTVGSIKSLGTDLLAFVPEDYEGVARTTSPDPGVYQFDPLPCTGVFNEDVDSLYPGGAFISWESFGNVTEWEIEWDVCGFTPGSLLGNVIPQVTNNQGFHLDSLPMGVCVCVYVREACPQGGFGPWNDPIEICVPIEYDAELVSLVNPEDGECGDSLMDVRVEIRNNGFFPITSLPIQLDMTGDINQSFTFTYTGNLLENEVDTVTVGTINSYWGGYVNVNAHVSLPNDQLLSNDSVSIDSLVILPFQPRVDDLAFCDGEDTITMNAMPLPNILYNWFDVDTGGVPIATGNSLTVPTAGQPTFYVAYNDVADSLESTASGNVQTANGGNMFDLDVFTALSITGFSVVGASSGLTDIEVYYRVGSLQGHENTPASWIFVETVQNVNLAGSATFVKFDLSNPIALAPGQVYGIYIQPVTGNFSYASGDPLGSSLGVNADLEILTGVTKAGLFGSTLSPRSWKGRVHYGSEGCSDIRTPVEVVPNTDTVVADFDFNELSHTVEFFNTSQNADSIVWEIEGTTYTTDTVVHQFAQTDSFQVCLIAYGVCDIDTICKTVWSENISVEEHSLAGSLKLFPNPSGGQFELTFNQPFASDVTLELLDLSGKSIWMEQLNAFSGPYSRRFDRGDLASGSYMLRVNNRDGIITKRVIINK